MRRHIPRNSLISTVSVLAVHTSWIIGGTVVIELVFAIPGLGYLLVSSIFARDYPLVQGADRDLRHAAGRPSAC